MTTIVSFMPAYAAAPVSLHLLKADVEGAAKKISALEGEVSVLVPSDEAELAARLAELLGDAARVVTADASLGFVYANDTACACVLKGEKPLPSEVTGTTPELRLIAGSELLGNEGSRWVWLEGASAPVELPVSTTVGALVEASGVADAKAVYVGYPTGSFFSASDADAAVELGSDYVRVYAKSSCMANALSEVCQLYRHETCGRCVFGHEGGHQVATIAADICRKKGKASDVALLRDLCPVMETQSLCEMGRVMARTVLSALDVFGDEIEQHFTKKVCPAGECKAYMTYHILPTKCVGCGECVDACEDEAILGKPRFIHVIDQKACTQCGRCVSACDEEAIIMAGADKPRTPPRPIPIRKR